MNAWKIGGILLCLTLAAGRLASAQTPSSPRVFVDAAIIAEHDPMGVFSGSDSATAARAAFGVRFSEPSSLRFEVDVPRWRVMETASSSSVWCAESASCVSGVGWIPARMTSRTAVRTVSYSVLYARHLQPMGRLQLAWLAGGSIEQRGYRSSGTFDELGPDGRVLRHKTFSDDYTKNWPAGVLGLDAEVKLSSHLAVTPQFRFHTFPYPPVTITSGGIALRWRF